MQYGIERTVGVLAAARLSLESRSTNAPFCTAGMLSNLPSAFMAVTSVSVPYVMIISTSVRRSAFSALTVIEKSSGFSIKAVTLSGVTNPRSPRNAALGSLLV